MGIPALRKTREHAEYKFFELDLMVLLIDFISIPIQA